MKMKHMAAAVFTLALCVGAARAGEGTPPPDTKRVPFSQVFTVADGRLTPNGRVRVGAATMSPGVSMACGGVKVSGVELCSLAGHDLAVTQDGDVTVVHGSYTK